MASSASQGNASLPSVSCCALLHCIASQVLTGHLPLADHSALVLNPLPGPLTILYFIPPTNQVDGTSQTNPFSTNQTIRSLGEVLGFPGGSDSKESACSAGDPGSIPRLGRSPGEGIGSPLQFTCLGNPMDSGAWWATDHGVTKDKTQLNTHIIFVP